MSHKIAIALVFFTSVFANAQALTPTQPATTTVNTPCELNAEDYAVFGAVVSGIGRPEDPEEAWHGKEFLITDSTVPGNTGVGDPSSRFQPKSKGAPAADTFADLKAKANDLCPFVPGFGDSNQYKMVSAKEIEEFFSKGQGGWSNFYKKYPKAAGFWSFSRPGYNLAHDEALLYVSHSCGGLCGTGHLFLINKKNGQWVVKSRVMLWIS